MVHCFIHHTGETFFFLCLTLPFVGKQWNLYVQKFICPHSIQVPEGASFCHSLIGSHMQNTEDLKGHDTINSTKNFLKFFLCFLHILHVVSLPNFPGHHSAWKNSSWASVQ